TSRMSFFFIRSSTSCPVMFWRYTPVRLSMWPPRGGIVHLPVPAAAAFAFDPLLASIGLPFGLLLASIGPATPTPPLRNLCSTPRLPLLHSSLRSAFDRPTRIRAGLSAPA